MNLKSVLLTILFGTALAPVAFAAVIGTNVPAQALTAERVANLPAWKNYLENSIRQQSADQKVLHAEMKAHGSDVARMIAQNLGVDFEQLVAFKRHLPAGIRLMRIVGRGGLMETEELRAIVTRHGGTKAFAARLKVSQRIVQMWLKGDRRIRPVIEDRIRSLKPPKTRKSNPKKER